ncbi:MAG: hypothetical protein JSS75_07305 [Bacteroidetes bacterium]|nr:hypothetical protein [Bacteroidota bacterium]
MSNFGPYDGPDANAVCRECCIATLRVVRCVECGATVCGECVSEHICDEWKDTQLTKIEVTQDDIDNGKFDYGDLHPIALAVARVFGHRVFIDGDNIDFCNDKRNDYPKLPKVALDWMTSYECEEHVAPFTFYLKAEPMPQTPPNPPTLAELHTCCLNECGECKRPCDCGYSNVGCMGCSACNEARTQEAVWQKPEIPTLAELRECPFCNSKPHSRWVGNNVPGMEDCGYWAVECPRCNGGRDVPFVGVHCDEQEDAERIWNTRPTIDALIAEREKGEKQG